jgi:hypothetical protein
MSKKILLFFLLWSCYGFSQEDAWVYFNDKPNAQAFIDNPLSMLTQRALDRRTNQGIALDITDVPLEQSYSDAIATVPGIVIKAKSKWLNCLHVRGSISAIQSLTALPFVNHVRFANNALNAKRTATYSGNPVTKQMETTTTFAYGNSANQIQMLNAQYLHEADYTGTGKIIAVLDSGFIGVDAIAPFNRFFTNGLFLGGYNYVAGSSDIFTAHNHGTMTLSCLVGYADGQLVGTAPDAHYYLFITEDVAGENPVEESYWVQAAEEADRLGADVISTSLGYFEYDNPTYSHTYNEMTGNAAFASQGANLAFSKGMIVVASAGNSGGGAEPHIGVPAEATSVFAVGAVKADRTYASFSSIGPSFDGRIKPDVMAQGENAVLSTTTGVITTASGTSFSCPIMAGAITCFWQAIPWATNAQVLDFVKQSADRYSIPDAQYGYGIPNFQVALDAALLSVELNDKTSFKMYPNPVRSQVVFSFPNTIKEASIEVYNVQAQKVFSKNNVNTNETISMDQLNPGVYYYKIQGGTVVQTGKIIKE